MATRDVYFPDGSYIDGVPDSMTDDQARQMFVQQNPEMFADSDRSWGEAAADTGLSVLSGLGGLSQIPQDLTNIALGDTDALVNQTGLAARGKQLQDWAQQQQSFKLQAQRAMMERDIQAADGWMDELLVTAPHLFTNPALLTSFLAEQAPNLVFGGGTGFLVKAGVGKFVASEVSKAATRAGIGTAIANNMGLQAGMYGRQQFDEAYSRLVQAGVPEPDAASKAMEIAQQTALSAAGVTGLSFGVPGGLALEKALVGAGKKGVKEAAKGAASKGAAKATEDGVLKSTLGEVAQQTIQEAGSQFGGNVAMREEFPDQPLDEGVGAAGTMGAVLGAFSGPLAGMTNRSRADEYNQLVDQYRKAVDDAAQAQAKERETAQATPAVPGRAPGRGNFTLEEFGTAQQGELFGETPAPAPAGPSRMRGRSVTAVKGRDGRTISFDNTRRARVQTAGGDTIAAPTLFVPAKGQGAVAKLIEANPGATPQLGYSTGEGTFTPVQDVFQIPKQATPVLGVVDAQGKVLGTQPAQFGPSKGLVPAMQVSDEAGGFAVFGSPIEEIQTSRQARAEKAEQPKLLATNVLTEDSMDALGIPRANKALRRDLAGLRWGDPVDRIKILEVLEKHGHNTQSESTRELLTKLMDNPDAQEALVELQPQPATDEFLASIGVREHAPLRRMARKDGPLDMANDKERQRLIDGLTRIYNSESDVNNRFLQRDFLKRMGVEVRASPAETALDALTARLPNMNEEQRAQAGGLMEVLSGKDSNAAQRQQATAEAQALIDTVPEAQGVEQLQGVQAREAAQAQLGENPDPLAPVQDTIQFTTDARAWAEGRAREAAQAQEVDQAQRQAEQTEPETPPEGEQRGADTSDESTRDGADVRREAPAVPPTDNAAAGQADTQEAAQEPVDESGRARREAPADDGGPSKQATPVKGKTPAKNAEAKKATPKPKAKPTTPKEKAKAVDNAVKNRKMSDEAAEVIVDTVEDIQAKQEGKPESEAGTVATKSKPNPHSKKTDGRLHDAYERMAKLRRSRAANAPLEWFKARLGYARELNPAQYRDNVDFDRALLAFIAGDIHVGVSDVQPGVSELYQFNKAKAEKALKELPPADQKTVRDMVARMDKEAERTAKLIGEQLDKSILAARRHGTDEDMVKVRASEIAGNTPFTALDDILADQFARENDGNLPALYRSRSDVNNRRLTALMYTGNTQGALDLIANDPTFPPGARRSAALLARHGRNLTLPAIEMVDPSVMQKEGAAGQYDYMTDTIQFTPGNSDAHVLLHELTHGFLHKAIVNAEVSGQWAPELKSLRELYETAKSALKSTEAANEYGLTNMSEFVSEAMSNPEFQQVLSTIPYRRTPQSLMQRFIEGVKKFFGLNTLGKMSDVLSETLLAADRFAPTGRTIQTQNVFLGRRDVAVPLTRAGVDALIAEAGYTPGYLSDGPRVHKINNDPIYQRAREATNSWIDLLETRILSSDAAITRAIRKELTKNNTDWQNIKDVMLSISSSQALHAHSMGNVFMDLGNMVFNENTHKYEAVQDENSWRSMIADAKQIAKNYDMSFDKFKEIAHTAFVAERTKALKEALPEFETRLNDDQIAAGIALFEAFPELRDLQAKWNGLRNNVLELMVDSGMIPRGRAEELAQAAEYVPFDRDEQVAAGAVGQLVSRNMATFSKIKKIKGSTRQEVNDVFENMERWVHTSVTNAVRNRYVNDLYKTTKEVFPDEVRFIGLDEPVRREDQPHVHKMWIDGQERKVFFEDPMWVEAFAGIHGAAIPMNNALTTVSNFLRQNIVLNPLFSLSQLAQDSFSAMTVSGLKSPLKVPHTVISEFIKNLRGTSAAKKALYKYGPVGQMDYTTPVAGKGLIFDAGMRKKSWMQRALSPLEKIAMAEDNSVRQAIFRLHLEETGGALQSDGTVVGGDEAGAIEKAYEFINFRRAGSSATINALRQIVPFFGAYLQAQNVILKTVSGRGISPVERKQALATLASTTAKLAALSLLYSSIVSEDEDYKAMDPTFRDRHLIIPGTGIALPIRQDFTTLAKVLPEYVYHAWTDEATTDGTKIRRGLRDWALNASLGPTALPQAVKPIIEIGMDHDLFTGRNIIGQGIAARDREHQYTANTSELAKQLGKYVPGLAPVQWDHLIRGYLGTTSGMVLMAADSVVQASREDYPTRVRSPRDELSSFPGMSTFVPKEQGTARLNDFYELREKVDEAVTTLNFLKRGDTRSGKARQFAADNGRLLRVKSQVNNIQNRLTKIRRRRDQINDLRPSRMSDAAKLAELQRLQAHEQQALSRIYELRKAAGL